MCDAPPTVAINSIAFAVARLISSRAGGREQWYQQMNPTNSARRHLYATALLPEDRLNVSLSGGIGPREIRHQRSLVRQMMFGPYMSAFQEFLRRLYSAEHCASSREQSSATSAILQE